MKRYFIREGKMTGLSSLLSVALPFGGILGTLYFQPNFWLGIIIIGLSILIGSIGIAAGAAESVGLKPFTNDPLGWRKAKESYESSSEDSQTKQKDPNP